MVIPDFTKWKGDQIITYLFLIFTLITPGLFFFYIEAYPDFILLDSTKILLISFLYGLPILLLAIFKNAIDPIFSKKMEKYEKDKKRFNNGTFISIFT